jgi:hypothetical protein
MYKIMLNHYYRSVLLIANGGLRRKAKSQTFRAAKKHHDPTILNKLAISVHRNPPWSIFDNTYID